MIWIECNVCGRFNSTDTYSLTDGIITALKEKGIPDNILAELNASERPVFSRRDAFIRSNPALDEFPCKQFLPIIAAKAHGRRKKCQWCGSDLSLRGTRWFPSAKFQKVTELLQPGKGDLPNGMSRLMPFVHPEHKVRPITKNRLAQLSALDLKAFKKGNQFGDDMKTLAAELPHCVFVLFDENNDVKGFLDVFFFEPNTFCLPEELLGNVEEGRLPKASDILNNRNLIWSKSALKNQVVDVYIDALCAEPGNSQPHYAMGLLANMSYILCSDAVFKTIRVNRMTSVSVENGDRKLRLPKGGQVLRVDPGDYYAHMAGMNDIYTGYDSEYGWARTLYTGNYQRSLIRLSWQGILMATRFLKYFLPFVSESSELIQRAMDTWEKCRK